jgi:phosphatidylglycerophosphatase A
MRPTPPRWTRSLPDWLIINVATLGPLGRKLPAPGTWGSLAGLLYFTVFFLRASFVENVIASVIGTLLAVGICGEAEVRLKQKDPGKVNLDEFTVMPLCFLGWGSLGGSVPVWAILLAGFALFRFFDILKPLGIARLQRLPGGWGVVMDDVGAALAACGALHAGVWCWSRF